MTRFSIAIDAPDYLIKASENANQVVIGAIFNKIVMCYKIRKQKSA